MQNTEPVFKSVGQALFIAFVMEITPPSQKGATQIMIEDLLERRYGEIQVPRSERTINMGGLTPLELRAQCAVIRDKVVQMPDFERDAIHARYGHRSTRASGVRGLRDYYASLCSTQNREAILAMLWAIYVPGARRAEVKPGYMAEAKPEVQRRATREQDWSLRHIEREYGVSRSALQRDQQVLRKLTHSLEMHAQGRLEQQFTAAGLIGDAAIA